MLPLRLSLEGFLSYRDRTEFDFSGSRLWMLSGPNGAGKSSVFDALRFVLYGTHRAGKQNAELLVHHESSRLRVEADVQLGEEVFRLVRTLGKGGARPTWQVRRKVGDLWADVPETAMKGDYERWIAAHIGLSDEAFCAAVYLSQGHADKILDSDPEARYDLLSQLVDLRVYEAWHERAEQRRSTARAAFQEARRRFELAPHADAQDLEAKREAALQLQKERDQLSQSERHLDSLRGEAAHWENWKGALARLEREARQGRALLGDEVAIERDFTRLLHLERHRPSLHELLLLAEREDALQSEVADLRAQIEKVERAAQEAALAHQSALEEHRRAQEAVQHAGEHLNALELEHARLAPGEDELARRQQLHLELQSTREQLAALERGESSVIEPLKTARDESRETARLLPSWRRFAQAQTSRREADARGRETQSRLDGLQARLAQRHAEEEALAGALAEAQHEAERAGANDTRARLRLEDAHKARRDFARVEGEARCHFCGQELSPQHARAECERLEREVEDAARQEERARRELNEALERRDQAQQNVSQARQATSLLEREATDTRLERALLLQQCDASRTLARAAWHELGEARRLVWDEEEFDFALESPRPDERELAKWDEIAAQLPAREGAVDQAEQQEREREALSRERDRLERDLAPLDVRWNDDSARHWHARWNALGNERATTRSALKQARQNALKLAKVESKCQDGKRAVRHEREELTARLYTRQGESGVLTRQVAALWPLVQAALEKESNGQDKGETSPALELLRGQSERWNTEQKALEKNAVKRRRGELQQARAGLEQLAGEADFLVRSLEALPPEARRPRAELEEELREMRELLEATRRQAKAAEAEVARLEREQQEKARLETELQQSEREHDRWSEVAHLLGPRQLQRHLLREAERGIVREANAVLEAISSGTLRLELRSEGDEHSARVPKVLDVVCHHLSGSAEARPVLPAFLSGSQRFRVAVALALGIGRTAARGQASSHGARVETILIDEGFGSLDKVGRDEMKDELRALGRELGRIILVSHQDDFAHSFPARFNIEMNEGVSRAQMIVE